MSQITYTQTIDEKTGEIKYVPNNPPQPPTPEMGKGDHRPDDNNTDLPEEYKDEVYGALKRAPLEPNDALTQVLTDLTANNKKLRFNKRLQAGKLDGRRLTAYKTSDRLFKLKAIKDKKYQFTFLIDSSGSMMSGPDDEDDETLSCMAMAMSAVSGTANSLKELGIRSSIFAMNNALEQVKSFEEDELQPKTFIDRMYKAIVGSFNDTEGCHINNAGGTSEWAAYKAVVDYIESNSDPKVTNVIIIVSDGEPGTNASSTPITIDGQTEMVEIDRSKDRSNTLAQFWMNKPNLMVFGLGIFRKARQVPTNRQIDDINKLPEVMGNLLTELML